jgi:hypothetical protein
MSWTRNRKSIGFAVGFAFAAAASMGHGSLAVAAQRQISFPANYSDVRLIHEKLLQALRLVYGPDVRLTDFGAIFPGGLTPQAKDQGLFLDYALPKAFTEERYMPFYQALKEVGIIQSADPRAEKKEAQIRRVGISEVIRNTMGITKPGGRWPPVRRHGISRRRPIPISSGLLARAPQPCVPPTVRSRIFRVGWPTPTGTL